MVRIEAATATAAFLGPRLSLKAQELGFEGSCCRLSAQAPCTSTGLSQGAPLVTRVERRLPALSSKSGNQTGPGQKMPGGREPPHVEADLGHHDLGGSRAQPRHLRQPLDGVAEGRKGGLGARIECRHRLLQLLDGLQMLIEKKAVMVPDTAVERLDEGVSRAAETPAAEFGKMARIRLTCDHRLEDAPPTGAQDVRDHRGQLDVRLLQHRLEALRMRSGSLRSCPRLCNVPSVTEYIALPLRS